MFEEGNCGSSIGVRMVTILRRNVPVLVLKSGTAWQHQNEPKAILNLRRSEAANRCSANGFELLNVLFQIEIKKRGSSPNCNGLPCAKPFLELG